MSSLQNLYVVINALPQPILCKRSFMSLDKSVLVGIVLVDFAQV